MKAMTSKFIHLHTHSHYSLLQALPKIPELVSAAKDAGMNALALTDNGNLYGAIEFYQKCQKEDIKPIIGVDFYVALRTRHDKESGIDNRRYRLVLLAENETGYKNLIKLVTDSHIEGFYYKPRIDHELMKRYSEGLIAILPSFTSEVAAPLKLDDTSGAQEKIEEYKNIYEGDNVYLEITHHPEIDGHQDLQDKIKQLAKSTDTPLIAAHDVYYINPDDRTARRTLLSVAGGAGFREQKGLTSNEEDFSFIDTQTAEEYFRDIPEALENTQKVADRCNLDIELGTFLFPEITLPKGTTPEKELQRITHEGLKNRGLENDKDAQERLAYELDVINEKGYASYFLVVADLMRFAHENDIYSTIRGSVAGSLTTYVMDITKINPLEYGLPFERFLNPQRPSAPDIDMDFADNRRDEVIAYAAETYGEANVAQIGTFGTMMARGSVRDTARALGYDYGTGDRIAKLIPLGAQGFPMTIDRAMEENPDLKTLYDTDEDAQAIIDMAKRIEGCARHISVHAAGVVISPVPLNDIVPIQQDPKGSEKHITQYDMYSVSGDEGGVGLVKFDFLGLKNLAILADAVRRVKKLLGVQIDIEEIPLDDKKTYELLAQGHTMGVFQLAGEAMTKFLKDLKPTTVHDINAMVALYRPGPMNNIPQYIERKHGKEDVTYMHPKMEGYLDKSFGILVYQDDIMTTALEISDYTWKTVDKLRKAIGKKIPAEMAKQHDIFVEGCIKKSGLEKKEAEALWDLFEPFQGYGFNKAHAASYGRVAYQTAYMKANYPVIYMASILTADSGNIDKVSEMIVECKRMDIEVLPPDVNESFGDFSVVFYENEPTDIRFGLHSVKNFGTGIADIIIEERKKDGPFTSLENFLERIQDKNLNKKSLESLIKCGALDHFGERGMMLANIDGLLEHSKGARSGPQNQDSLFGLMEDTSTVPQITLRPVEPATSEEKLRWEKELLGLYISGHPLDKFKSVLEDHDIDISTMKEEIPAGSTTIVHGVIEESKSIITKAGEQMAFLRVSDYSGSIEVVLFPRVYAVCKGDIETDSCVSIKGTLSDRGGDLSILADAVKEIARVEE